MSFCRGLHTREQRARRSLTARASCGLSPGSFPSRRITRLRKVTLAHGATGTGVVRCASRSVVSSPEYGGTPERSSKARQPNAYKSVLTVGDFRCHSSGAIYGAEPQQPNVGSCVPISASRAIPKSASFQWSACQSTFLGFRSRWMTPALCSCPRPVARSWRIGTTCPSGTLPTKSLRHLSPRSITSNNASGVSPASTTGNKREWGTSRILRPISTSRRSRRESNEPPPGLDLLTTFTAIGLSSSDRASNT